MLHKNPTTELQPDEISYFQEKAIDSQKDPTKKLSSNEINSLTKKLVDEWNSLDPATQENMITLTSILGEELGHKSEYIWLESCTDSEKKLLDEKSAALKESKRKINELHKALTPEEKSDVELAIKFEKKYPYSKTPLPESEAMLKDSEDHTAIFERNQENEKIKEYQNHINQHNKKAEEFNELVSNLKPINVRLAETEQTLASTEADLKKAQQALDNAKSQPNASQTANIGRLNQLVKDLRQQKSGLEAQIQNQSANPSPQKPGNRAEIARLSQENSDLQRELQDAQANPPARESRGKTGNENKKHSTGKVVGITLGSVALVSVPLLAWLIMQNQQLHKVQAQQATR